MLVDVQRPDIQVSHEASPLIRPDFADSTYCNGFLFATQNVDRGISIQVARLTENGSAVLEPRDALAYPAPWADKTSADQGWAPHVRPFVVNRELVYKMYFCAKAQGSGLGIGVATSHNLSEPFIPDEEPLVHGEGFEHIDPYVDSHTEITRRGIETTHEMYWGSMHRPIKRRLLTADASHFDPDSPTEEIISPDPKHKDRILLEAPSPVRVGNDRFLLLSGNGCFFPSDYFISIAKFSDEKGKYEFREDADQRYADSIIIDGRNDPIWANPGHQEIIRAENGLYILYSAIDRNGAKDTDRSLLVSRLEMRNGWLEASGGVTPSENAIQQLVVLQQETH